MSKNSKKNSKQLDLTKDINRAIELLDSLSKPSSGLPVQKLQNLKAILQSQFLHNVKDVYQSGRLDF